MTKIAFGWELGANYGHLAAELPLAECLRRQGHDVSFVLGDLRIAEELLTPAGFSFVACPYLAQVQQPSRAPINYSHLLEEFGYADERALRPLVRGWVNLWRVLRPQVVVIDHAPTALLAARMLSIPAVLLGAGFSIPPIVSPLPAIRPWERTSAAELLQADGRVLATINAVIDSFGQRRLDRIADLFAGLPAHLTTFAELDCYGRRPALNYVGPLSRTGLHPRIAWDQRPGRKRVIAYLRPSIVGLEPLLNALRQAPLQLICVIAGASEAMITRLRVEGLEARRTPVNLDALLPEADLVVSYGGAAVIAQSLLQAVPLLIVPQNLEQYLNATRVANLGAGILVDSNRTRDRFSHALSELLNEPGYKAAARAFADEHTGDDRNASVERVALAIADTGGRC